ncbi:MAG: DUF432 domain-containing protein [Puniceicoccaceae bacterium]|nr:MAG: DUF432 domain-containing protein [Puniceicoccaceae bacterium]
MSSGKTPWGALKFADQKEIRLEWAQLQIRLIRRGSDLLLVEQRGNSEIVQLGDDPESDFRRYAFERAIHTIYVQPRMPDRPIVVQPLHPLRLAPKANVDFYVSIPVDIQISTNRAEGAEGTENLERIRSELLSDTWFGDRTAGVLCYSTKSRARREAPSVDTAISTRAVCKVCIHNKSNEQLHCTKFCLRLNHCHLWQSGQAIWTSPVDIRYNGSEQLSAIDYSEQAPPELVGAIKIADAPDPPATGLIRRSFASLSTALA